MTYYFKTKNDALYNALEVRANTRGDLILEMGKAQCDCGESLAIILDDLKSQVLTNVVCETCYEQYG